MPKTEYHLQIADRNQLVLDYLRVRIDDFPEWVAVLAFYKAVHLVEAVLAVQDKHHSHSHESRELKLKSDQKYSNIWKHYRPLWAASVIARYHCESGDPAKQQAFTGYMKPEEVQAELLGHRLNQIQKTTKKFLEPTPSRSKRKRRKRR